MEKNKKVVYFAGAIRGNRIMADTFREIVSFLKTSRVEVLTEHVAAQKVVDEELPAADIEKRDIEWLDRAPYVIAEISGASTGTGREIEYARTKHNFGKPPAKILCIYQKEREFYASPMIRGMTPDMYPNVEVRAYESIEEAKSIIKQFLNL